MSKGFFMSFISLLLLITVISFVWTSSLRGIEVREMVSRDILSDRIYYKHRAIVNSVVEIMREELGKAGQTNELNVTVVEEPDFSYVTFREKLPQNVSDFNEDLARYEQFVEIYLPEKNIEVDTSIGNLGGKMILKIDPYDIVYTHEEDFGHRQYAVIPEDVDYSLGSLNSYDIDVQLINGWSIISGTENWGPLKSGDLKAHIIVRSDVGGPSYETTQYISRDKKSTFIIDTERFGFQGWVRARFAEPEPGSLRFEMHLAEAIVETELNLTEIPGKTKVDLSEGQINVKEILYNIEKNDTPYVI